MFDNQCTPLDRAEDWGDVGSPSVASRKGGHDGVPSVSVR